MSTKISSKVKDKVWKDYTRNKNSKSELKQMFLGSSPSKAYQKISVKLKKKLNEETLKSPSRSLKPTKSPSRKLKTTKSPSRKLKTIKSPSRKLKTTKSPSRKLKTTKSPLRSLKPKNSKKKKISALSAFFGSN